MQTHCKPSSKYSSGFIASCLSVFNFFLRAFLCSTIKALVAALRSSTSFSRVYSARASGEMVSVAGLLLRILVRGSDLKEYHSHAGGPSVLNPAALTRGCSSWKSWNWTSKRRRVEFQLRFIRYRKVDLKSLNDHFKTLYSAK